MGLARRLIARCAIVAATTGCFLFPGTKPEEEAVREIRVRPSGSVIDTVYWDWNETGQVWKRTAYPEDYFPGEWAEVVTVVPYPASAPPVSGALTYRSTADDANIGGLATGGRSISANAVRNATLHLPGIDPIKLQMVVARTGHKMAPLPGERMLIAGGYGPSIPTPVLSSAEVFTLSTRSFAATGSMSAARASFAMAALADGRVLVAGGLVPIGGGPVTTTTGTTEIYNPASGTFSNGPAMSVARASHSAVTLNDGRILILGGNALKSAEVYTAATNAFTNVGSMSVNHGYGHVSVKLTNGKVLVLGGDISGNIQPTAVAELYDPVTNTFTSAGNMTAPRMQHFAVLMSNGKVLIGGGRTTGGDALASAEIYDPAMNSFTRTGDMPAASYDQVAGRVSGKGP